LAGVGINTVCVDTIMVVRKVRDCRHYIPGKCVRVLLYTMYNNGRVVERGYRNGRILPIDPAAAKEQFPQDDTIVGHCSCVLADRGQYIFVEIPRELNPEHPMDIERENRYIDVKSIKVLKKDIVPVQQTQQTQPTQPEANV
jgi:hypothetical protein